MELGEHEIIFKPRTKIKAHALAYFSFEIMGNTDVSSVVKIDLQVTNAGAIKENQWSLYSDGSSSIEGAIVSLIIKSTIGEEVTYALNI